MLGLVLGVVLLAWSNWDAGAPQSNAPLEDSAPTPPPNEPPPSGPGPTVVYVAYGQNPRMNPIRDAFFARLEASGVGAHIVALESGGDPNASTRLVQQIRDLPDVAVVVATTAAVAVPVAESVRGRSPLVFVAVSDPVSAGLVPSLSNAPGSGVTGSSDGCTVDAQLALIHEVLPDADRLGFLHGELSGRASLPIDEASAHGLTLVPVESRVRSDLQRVEQSLASADIDALLVHPSWAADDSVYAGFPELARAASERRWPLVVTGETNVRRGALAGIGSDLSAAGTAAADATVAILRGAEPGSIPVSQVPCAPPVVNRAVASALGVELPAPVLDRARFIEASDVSSPE